MGLTGEILHDTLLPLLEGVKNSGGAFVARCPAHEDHNPSLSIKPGTSQPVVLHCHAGCDTDAILAAVGLTFQDISAPREDRPRDVDEWTPAGPASDVYDYRSADGELVFQVLRVPLPGGKKTFRQRVPDRTTKSGWRWNLDGVQRVIYRLPEVLAAINDGREVWIVEGEKDVHTLLRHGVAATCNAQGAGKWLPEFSVLFADAHVRVVADCDKPGQAHARQVADSLADFVASVTIVEPAAGKDITDHLNAGKSLDEVKVTWSSDPAPAVDLAQDLHQFLAVVDPPTSWVIPGLLERGDRLIWTGTEGLGKRLRVDEPIPTPDGWTTMGALRPGDTVYGRDGQPCTVTWCSPIEPNPVAYRLTFSDGTTIEADEEHQWITETLAAREAAAKFAKKSATVKKRGTDQRHKRKHFPAVITTGEIARTLYARNGHAVNHSIEVTAPIDGPPVVVPIDPYVLGTWLGDGTTKGGTITLNRDDAPHFEAALTEAGHTHHRVPSGERPGCVFVRVDNFESVLRASGFLGHKHIPTRYLRASATQRWALLAGLMDTDGHIVASYGSGRGSGAAVCEVTLTCKGLAADLLELVLSLGIKANMAESDAKIDGRIVGRRWRITFQADRCPFTLPRHVERWQPLRTRRARLRYITSCEPCEPSPMRCIEVDSPDHMYLAGRSFLPTHNTMVVRMLAVCAAAGVHPFTDERFTPQRVLMIDCENSERQSRKHFRNLERVARLRSSPVPDGGMFIIHRPAGIDLARAEDAAWLLERVTAHEPDLLICGPFYRLHAAEREEESAARRVVAALDAARVQADCALVVEHHAPHASNGARSLRPFGSSLLMRWPEMGMGIAPASEDTPCRNVDVKPWRGNRDERHWPRALRWGNSDTAWPWVVDENRAKDFG